MMRNSVLIFFLLAALLFCACSKTSETDSLIVDIEAGVSKEEETSSEAAPLLPVSGGLGIANPMKESSREEILKELQIDLFPPEGATDLHYTRINEQLAQLDFSLEGTDYRYRIKKTSSLEDISGVYGDFENEESLFYHDREYSIRYSAGKEGLALWFDSLSSQSHCLHMEKNASLQGLKRLAESYIK